MSDPGPPGVYIVELPASGPIAGVGTSTAAFIGAAAKGPPLEPTFVVNWTQFRDAFGDYLPPPRGYLAHAVRGFFGNGGTSAYVVRVSTATQASLELADRADPPRTSLVVRARHEGPAGEQITVEVQDAQIVPEEQGCEVHVASASVTGADGYRGDLQDPDDVRGFRRGDVVTVEGAAGRFTVVRIDGPTLVVEPRLPAPAGAGSVRTADLRAGQSSFRVRESRGIEAGSVIQLRRGNQSEQAVVSSTAGDRLTLAQGLRNDYPLDGEPVRITTLEFTLVVSRGTDQEIFAGLSMDRRHSRHVRRAVTSELVEALLPDPPTVTPPPDDRPAVRAASSLRDGAPDDPAELGTGHYTAALTALDKVDDVSLVCVPGRSDPEVQGAVIGHCELRQDRFAILDSTPGAPPTGSGSVLEQRAALDSERGFAALYYPWLVVPDPVGPRGAEPVPVPPSGHVAGIFARNDTQRGVHKAPANESVSGAVRLERVLEEAEHGQLNRAGVNALRVFAGQGRPVVWGARTTAPEGETAWRYVNVRRLLLFIEESIRDGVRWAVFEPNDLSLRKALIRTVTEFLARVWSSGALFGATPSEAFYVVCDDELNPPDVRELGQVVMEVGVAPVRPAEFVVVRIGLWPGARTDEG